ncbi:hypothetical protein GJ496_011418 [Pomphorhynchus laevis]|nr:hypothetical protein GJ496_011418 [Pomphorhynchus laevis]
MASINSCPIKINDQISNWSTSDWPDKSTIAGATDIVTPKDTVKSYHAPGIVRAQLSRLPAFSLPTLGNAIDKSPFVGIDNSIICSIQLGIHQSIDQVEQRPERDLLIQDFQSFENTVFPQAGSDKTSKHEYPDFRFSVVAPTAFRYFRNFFQIRSADFIKSICSQPLVPLSNPGSSGSILYVTGDDRFILKSVQKREAIFLMRLLPGYFLNVIQNPQTLLPKFFGMYAYSSRLRKVRFIVMNNLIPSNIRIDVRYDLKGSSHKRYASDYERSKPNPTLKDLDFFARFGNGNNKSTGIWLQKHTYEALLNTMHKDCRVLQSFSIMDYSLLLGIHECSGRSTHNDDRPSSGDAKALTGYLTSMGSIAANILHQNKNADDNQSTTSSDTLAATISTNRRSIIPKAHSNDDTLYGGIPAFTSSGDHLFLFIGIIDILQSYNTRKRMEHVLKSVLNDPYTISVIDPNAYCTRFLKFMSEVVFRPISATTPVTSPSGMSSHTLQVSSNRKFRPYQHRKRSDSKHSDIVVNKFTEYHNSAGPILKLTSSSNISNSLRSAKHFCIPIVVPRPTITTVKTVTEQVLCDDTKTTADQNRICILSTQL